MIMAAGLLTCASAAHAETCRASFYGAESGNRTASGAHFDPMKHTAAHRAPMPFGTRLHVTFRGRSVDVVVNDRGPFTAGRCIDLSLGAARAIGLEAAGVGTVTIERLN